MKSFEVEAGFTVMIPEQSYNLLMKLKATNKEKITRKSLSDRACVIADSLVANHLLNRDDEYYYILPSYEKRNSDMKLTESKRRSLKIINETLKKEHNFTVSLDETISQDTLRNIKRDVLKEQRELSYSESPQSDPLYSQCALVLEAVDLLLGEKQHGYSGESERTSKTIFEQVDELEAMLEKLPKKSAKAKRKIIEGKIEKLRGRIYQESKEQEIRMMLSEDAQRAEVIMAAKGLLDTVQGFQTKIGDLMNKNLDPFIERVRAVYGSKTADTIYTKLDSSLEELLDNVKTSKDSFFNVVGELSGDGGLDDEEDLSSDEDDVLDMETDDVDLDLDLEDETDEDEGDDEDFELDLDDLEDSAETFTRKED